MLPSRTYALHSPHKPDLGFLPCPNLSFEYSTARGGGEEAEELPQQHGQKNSDGLRKHL